MQLQEHSPHSYSELRAGLLSLIIYLFVNSTFIITYCVLAAVQGTEYCHGRVVFPRSFIYSFIQLIQHFIADETDELLLL